jgi:hypothetical protein
MNHGTLATASATPRPAAARPQADGALRPEVRLLAEVALVAACRGMGAKALPIFDALEHHAPDHPVAAVGRAMIELMAGNADAAAQILRVDALGKRHGRSPVQGLLLLALVSGGREAEALKLADEIAAGPDGAARRLAANMGPALRNKAAAQSRR